MEQMCRTHVYCEDDHCWYELGDQGSCQATHISKQPDYNKHDAEALARLQSIVFPQLRRINDDPVVRPKVKQGRDHIWFCGAYQQAKETQPNCTAVSGRELQVDEEGARTHHTAQSFASHLCGGCREKTRASLSGADRSGNRRTAVPIPLLPERVRQL